MKKSITDMEWHCSKNVMVSQQQKSVHWTMKNNNWAKDATIHVMQEMYAFKMNISQKWK